MGANAHRIHVQLSIAKGVSIDKSLSAFDDLTPYRMEGASMENLMDIEELHGRMPVDDRAD